MRQVEEDFMIDIVFIATLIALCLYGIIHTLGAI